MEFMERYWSMASDITGIISLLMEGWMFGFFVKPFLLKLQSARISGIVYAMLMVILYILPMEFEYPRIIVCFTTFCVLGVLDRKNMAQKSVLVIMMYLFSWIAHGVALIPRNVLYTGRLYGLQKKRILIIQSEKHALWIWIFWKNF